MSYPGEHWNYHSKLNWSESNLDYIKKFVSKQRTFSMMVVQNGHIVLEYGDITKKLLVHSCRKSFMSALLGILVDQCKLNLGLTMNDLNIDDNDPPLTSTEKQATVLDLIKSRSGVYHPAAYETQSMKIAKPLRGSKLPGDFWYYNNWDFNVLGGIFSNISDACIYDQLHELIAKPLQMEDYTPQDGLYILEPDSNFPAYDFSMSTRDMARFGHLYLMNGYWNDNPVISSNWISRSTSSYSSNISKEGFPFTGYGFLWWTANFGYMALGYGGHMIAVIPSKNLVIVHRVDNDDESDKTNSVSADVLNVIVRLIIDASPE